MLSIDDGLIYKDHRSSLDVENAQNMFFLNYYYRIMYPFGNGTGRPSFFSLYCNFIGNDGI